jgi:hypothetical protein
MQFVQLPVFFSKTDEDALFLQLFFLIVLVFFKFSSENILFSLIFLLEIDHFFAIVLPLDV